MILTWNTGEEKVILLKFAQIVHGLFDPEAVCSLFKLNESAGTRRLRKFYRVNAIVTNGH